VCVCVRESECVCLCVKERVCVDWRTVRYTHHGVVHVMCSCPDACRGI